LIICEPTASDWSGPTARPCTKTGKAAIRATIKLDDCMMVESKDKVVVKTKMNLSSSSVSMLLAEMTANRTAFY
jgi:hypothetical protein